MSKHRHRDVNHVNSPILNFDQIQENCCVLVIVIRYTWCCNQRTAADLESSNGLCPLLLYTKNCKNRQREILPQKVTTKDFLFLAPPQPCSPQSGSAMVTAIISKNMFTLEGPISFIQRRMIHMSIEWIVMRSFLHKLELAVTLRNWSKLLRYLQLGWVHLPYGLNTWDCSRKDGINFSKLKREA